MPASTPHVRSVSRAEGLAAKGRPGVLCVDSADCAPEDSRRFRCFNPFHFDPAVALPVPGQARVARSLESIWQGLKLVDGETDFAMFDAPPYKRPSEEERRRSPDYVYAASTFLYGDRRVDIVTARYAIYLPAYLHLIEHVAPAAVIDELVAHLRAGGAVLFFDWDDNFDIEDDASSFSHSSILAAWLGGQLEQRFLTPARAHLGARDIAIPPMLAAAPARYLHTRERLRERND